jgi:hypothetical protein
MKCMNLFFKTTASTFFLIIGYFVSNNEMLTYFKQEGFKQIGYRKVTIKQDDPL